MLEFEQLKKDIDALPEDDRQLVSQFVAMLKKRHDHGSDNSESPRQIQALDLDNEPFVGMWRDRPEMQDSAAWLKQVRQHHWG